MALFHSITAAKEHLESNIRTSYVCKEHFHRSTLRVTYRAAKDNRLIACIDIHQLPKEQAPNTNAFNRIKNNSKNISVFNTTIF